MKNLATIRSQIYYWKSDRPAVIEKSPRKRRSDSEMTKMLWGELRRVFPGKEITLESGNGQGNHIIYLAGIGDLKGFIRVEDGPEEGDCFELETRIINLLRRAGVPVPEVYAVDATRARVPFAWQILERINQPDLNQHHKTGSLDLPMIAEKIGAYVGRWQQIEVSGYGPFMLEEGVGGAFVLDACHETYPHYFFLHLERHLAFLYEHDFLKSAQVDEMLKAVDEHKDQLDLASGCLVHKDLALWNILGTPTEISAFIDWEDSIAGDPMDDFSLLGCFYSGKIVQRALDGYQSHAKLPSGYRTRFWLHLLRNLLVKAVIRIEAGYFQQTDALFLIEAGTTGHQLKTFTQERLLSSLRGLREDREIGDL